MTPRAANLDPLFNWLSSRSAGVLLHPTSLPGGQGIGTFDGAALRFLEFLQAAGMTWWQVCPLGPTGYGDSPYQCFSAFAGNPYLIDLQGLVAGGLLGADEIAPLASLGADSVDFGALFRLKWPLLRRAFSRHKLAGSPALGAEGFAEFRAAQASWLEPYAWFRALKDHFGGRAWWEWPQGARSFSSLAPALRKQLNDEADAHQFYQYLFFAQWRRIRAEAARRGIGIIGDIPIFVAADSADAWVRPGLFELAQDGRPVAVAGVPPDYFSEDGQLWGNPLYRWEVHSADGYAWWKERLRASFDMYDVVRIDHFRGFDTYWRIPLPALNARAGEWRQGPGLGFFRAVSSAFPDARIIAEDLGLLTPSVEALLRDTGLPGMAVLQFAFGGNATNAYLPHNLRPNGVVYPGTHDNDTTLGWYATAGAATRDHARRYLRVGGDEIGWDFIRAAYAAVSWIAVIPAQDLLSLGSEARLNTPGKPEGNWRWRLSAGHLEQLAQGGMAAYLAELASRYGRAPSGGPVRAGKAQPKH
jgi:4-alpha-glucanotransferase